MQKRVVGFKQCSFHVRLQSPGEIDIVDSHTFEDEAGVGFM